MKWELICDKPCHPSFLTIFLLQIENFPWGCVLNVISWSLFSLETSVLVYIQNYVVVVIPCASRKHICIFYPFLAHFCISDSLGESIMYVSNDELSVGLICKQFDTIFASLCKSIHFISVALFTDKKKKNHNVLHDYNRMWWNKGKTLKRGKSHYETQKTNRSRYMWRSLSMQSSEG